MDQKQRFGAHACRLASHGLRERHLRAAGDLGGIVVSFHMFL